MQFTLMGSHYAHICTLIFKSLHNIVKLISIYTIIAKDSIIASSNRIMLSISQNTQSKRIVYFRSFNNSFVLFGRRFGTMLHIFRNTLRNLNTYTFSHILCQLSINLIKHLHKILSDRFSFTLTKLKRKSIFNMLFLNLILAIIKKNCLRIMI